MEKFREFTNKYYIKEILLILAASLFMFFLFYGKYDAYLVDVGREAYIPWQMLKGKLLYKDIFNVYGPLGYQINAMAYALFGVNLNTLYLMGFANSLIILVSVFFISRQFLSKPLSLVLTGMVLVVCAYARGFFNFIFVYSYNAVYALSGFLLSLLFALFYIRGKKTRDIVLSYLFAGFSFANKIEDLPYFCLLFVLLPLWLKKDWKKYFYAAGAFFFFPVISFGILLLQGVGINDLLDAFVLIKKLVNAPATNYFYHNYGLYFNPVSVNTTIKFFFKLIKVLIMPCAALFMLFYVSAKYLKDSFLKHLSAAAAFIFAVYLIKNNFNSIIQNSDWMFSWSGIACIFILLFFAGRYIYSIFYKKLAISQIPVDDIMFMFLAAAAISVSFKGLFSVSLACYGTFTFTALLLAIVIFLVKYVPLKFSHNIYAAWVETVKWLCIIAIIGYFAGSFYRLAQQKVYTVKSPQGSVTIRDVYPAQNELINYLREKTPENARIVTLPEGALINFLAQRDSDNMYYYLIPVNIDIFGQERVLNDFKKNPPEYFLLSDIMYGVYNVGAFCDYASKVCDYIFSQYKAEVSVIGTLKFVLYKKK